MTKQCKHEWETFVMQANDGSPIDFRCKKCKRFGRLEYRYNREGRKVQVIRMIPLN